jgi:type I restriction enzyme S subunit
MSELNIPESWAEGTIADTAIDSKNDIVDGPFGSRMKSSEYKTTGIPILRLQNIQRNEFVFKNFMYISEIKSKELSRHSYMPGDIIITKLGAPLGKACIVPDTFPAGNIVADLVRLRVNNNWFNREFVTYQLNSKALMEQFESHTKGATRPRVNLTHVRSLKIAVPPKVEQDRIVQKIETCFEKIDSTEANLNKAEKLLEKYRESLLAKAFRGELVSQDPNDEPASVLLEKIRKERAQNQKGKKAEQEFAPIADDEKPFDLPVGWEWVCLGDYLSVETGATPLKSNRDYYRNGNIPWLTSSVTSKPFVTEADQFITTKALEETNCKLFPAGTLLVAMYGEGKTRGQVTEMTFDATTNQAVAAILFKESAVDIKGFVKLYFQAMYEKIRSEAAGGTQLNLNSGNIKAQIIPLPPLKEQKRIINKLNYDLERITKNINLLNLKLKKLKLLKNSLLQKAFEGRLVEQIASEGTGHELLAKILSEKNIKIEKETKVSKVSKITSTKSKGNKNGKK